MAADWYCPECGSRLSYGIYCKVCGEEKDFNWRPVSDLDRMIEACKRDNPPLPRPEGIDD